MTKWSLGGDYIITKCWINGNWILTKRSLNIDEMITIWWLKSHFILSDCLQMLSENQLNVNEMGTYCWTIHVYNYTCTIYQKFDEKTLSELEVDYTAYRPVLIRSSSLKNNKFKEKLIVHFWSGKVG